MENLINPIIEEDNHPVTYQELIAFKIQLLHEFKHLLKERHNPTHKKWLKSNEVRAFLGISHGTLQTLRDTGKLPFSRIGGVIYYSREELEQLLDKNHSLTL